MIPKNAKRVFKGVLFDVYQWEQKQYNGTYRTFERLRRVPTVDVIATTVDDKILVLRQTQPTRKPYYCLPAGKIESGEHPKTAAGRELLEETGYSGNLRFFKSYAGTSLIAWPEFVYVANNCKKTGEQNFDGGEKIKVFKYDFEDFLQLCRRKDFIAPRELKFMMYEALLESKLKDKLYKKIYHK